MIVKPIECAIATYIAEHVMLRKNGYPYSVNASLLDREIVDPVNILELVMFVEEHFGLNVEEDELNAQNFDSVAGIARYVQQKQRNKDWLAGEG